MGIVQLQYQYNILIESEIKNISSNNNEVNYGGGDDGPARARQHDDTDEDDWDDWEDLDEGMI